MGNSAARGIHRTLGRPPNRMTTIFQEMKKTCPDAIKAYASCVSYHHGNGSLEKGSCEADFDLVKECFRLVRK